MGNQYSVIGRVVRDPGTREDIEVKVYCPECRQPAQNTLIPWEVRPTRSVFCGRCDALLHVRAHKRQGAGI